MASTERRNDLGSKLSIAGTTFIVGLFINTVWGTASDAKEIAIQNKVDIATTRECLVSFKDDLHEIKELLKRRLPNG